MTTRVRWVAALLAAALALPGSAMAQHGAPVSIVRGQRVGPYVVAVWAAPDVGMGRVYVVYEAAKDVPFVRPTRVRVGVAPVSGRVPETLYDAHPERVRQGARFMTHVAFDRSEEWRVRVITDGPAGSAELTTRVHAMAGGFGPIGLAVYSLPFVALAVLRWRAKATVRRRTSGRGPHAHLELTCLPARLSDRDCERRR